MVRITAGGDRAALRGPARAGVELGEVRPRPPFGRGRGKGSPLDGALYIMVYFIMVNHLMVRYI